MNTSTSRSIQTIVLVLIALGLIGLALGGYLSSLSRLFINPVTSAQGWITSRYQAVQSILHASEDTTVLRQRNVELEAEVSRLQVQIIELQQQIADTKILSALVDFARANPEYEYQAATVVATDPSPFLQYVIINSGSDNGLRRGMPVVTQQGLVGRISGVTAGAARVQLIIDPASSVNIRLEPSGAQAMIAGQITGDITLEMIPQEADVKAGDLVLTSGLGGGYPANILIGQVSGVRKRDQDLFQRASVQPVVDFSQLSIVLVITNFEPIDYEPLIPPE